MGRFALSFLREDSLIFGLRQAQWASLLMIAVSAAVISLWMLRTVQAPAASKPGGLTSASKTPGAETAVGAGQGVHDESHKVANNRD